jgi:hypothetical protein
MAKEDSKINVKYGVHGLTKVENDGVLTTTLNGKTPEDMPLNSQTWLMHYGFFVYVSRLTANEKNVDLWAGVFADALAWFMAGMPQTNVSRKKTETEKTLIERENTVKTLTSMIATMSKNDAKTLTATIEKINVEIETLKVQIIKEKNAAAKTE